MQEDEAGEGRVEEGVGPQRDPLTGGLTDPDVVPQGLDAASGSEFAEAEAEEPPAEPFEFEATPEQKSLAQVLQLGPEYDRPQTLEGALSLVHRLLPPSRSAYLLEGPVPANVVAMQGLMSAPYFAVASGLLTGACVAYSSFFSPHTRTNI